MKPLMLAVDDSKAIRYLLQTIFAKRFQVVTAADAASAMFWLSQKNFPDIIITSAQLSDVGDWEFVANLKNSALYKDIPTVILSSGGSENTKKQCNKYNVEKYFLKPFNPVFLIETVEHLAGLRTRIAATHAKP